MTPSFTSVVYCCAIFLLSSQVSLFQCQVTVVTRNNVDSFRFGNSSCKVNETVCTVANAFCQVNDLCQCNYDRPHFRNPIIFLSKYGTSYGCVAEPYIRTIIGQPECELTPFQRLPYAYRRNETANEFTVPSKYHKCDYFKVEVKYPDSNLWRDTLSWLNGSYIHVFVNMSSSKLNFKWVKSVPELQGTIIRMQFVCAETTSPGTIRHKKFCFMAKVSGTWELYGKPKARGPEAPTKAASTNWKTVAIAVIVVAILVIALLVVALVFVSLRMLKLRRNQEDHPANSGANVDKQDNGGYADPTNPSDFYTDIKEEDVEHFYQGLQGVDENNDKRSNRVN